MIHLIKQHQVLQQPKHSLLIRIAKFVFYIVGLNYTKASSFFQKLVALGVVTRSGETSCSSTSFVLNSGTTCCQTDLCNGARTNNQIFIMLIISLIITLAQIQCV